MKYPYRFSEGISAMADLRGGKGANFAEIARLGLPVPPASPSPSGDRPRFPSSTTAVS